MEHIVLEHIWISELEEMINKDVDKYFEAGYATEALRERMLRSENVLNRIASFV